MPPLVRRNPSPSVAPDQVLQHARNGLGTPCLTARNTRHGPPDCPAADNAMPREGSDGTTLSPPKRPDSSLRPSSCPSAGMLRHGRIAPDHGHQSRRHPQLKIENPLTGISQSLEGGCLLVTSGLGGIMNKRIVAVVLAASVVAMLSSTQAASASSPAAPTPPTADLVGLVDSASLTTPVVASGHILKSDGSAAAFADVVLYAWPANDALKGLSPGDGFKLQAVGAATADINGAYTLRIASADLVSPMADSSGIINFEIDAGAIGQGTVPFGFPRKFDPSTGSMTEIGGTPPALASGPTASGSLWSVAPEHADVVLPLNGASTGTQNVGPPGSTSAVNKGSCTLAVVTNYGPGWDIVGQTYSTTTGVTHQFVYTSGSSSSLGEGFSLSGAYGSFSASGTTGVGSTGSETYPVQGNGQYAYYETEFTFEKFRRTCINPRQPTTVDYLAKAVSWAAGAQIQRPSGAPAAGYCVSQLAGSVFRKESTTAITWTNGFSVGGFVGINLSTDTGYSTSASVEYSFSAQRHLCGTGGYPGGTPYQLVAQA